MSRPFKFKKFTIKQEKNPQKVGSDSMLLGAWVAGEFKRILDIGTGTGILALMLAQKNPTAVITAIEPDLDSLQEAQGNFNTSPYRSQILAVHTPLQQFGALEKFDLIIANPPYFENAFLGNDNARNQARHNDFLPVHDLYEGVEELLAEEGKFAVVIPFDEEDKHLHIAAHNELHPHKILRTVSPNGSYKRSLIEFGFGQVEVQMDEIVVKTAENKYTSAYIELTRAFYAKELDKI